MDFAIAIKGEKIASNKIVRMHPSTMLFSSSVIQD